MICYHLKEVKGPTLIKDINRMKAFSIILLWPYSLTSKFGSRSLHILYPTIILWMKYRAKGKENILWRMALQRSATTLTFNLETWLEVTAHLSPTGTFWKSPSQTGPREEQIWTIISETCYDLYFWSRNLVKGHWTLSTHKHLVWSMN